MTIDVISAARPLRIGTRRSPLALAQAEMVAASIRNAHGLSEAEVVQVPMLASGDKIQDRPLADIGGKALWTKELERALIDDVIDIGVHSMKDVETVRPDIFTIAAMLPRADVRDRLIGAASIQALAHGARLGTSSPRRAAQMLRLRPDLQIVPLRGNVATRLARIEAGEADATLLAAAGLDRLGKDEIGHAVATDQMLPAASQGAIGIDRLSTRDDLGPLLDAINDAPTFTSVMAERAFLEALGGSCHSPVAALAEVSDDMINLWAQIYNADGSNMQAGHIHFPVGDYRAPTRLATDMLAGAHPSIAELFKQ
jgi:hydroxymethylbilane synthase